MKTYDMKRFNKKLKKYISVFLIFLMTLNMSVNASLISSNDGASFITKKEFELLKQNYKEKIAAFEKNIDNRIDNAINSYLDNMKIADTVSLTPFVLVGVRGSTNVIKSASPSYVKKDKQM